MGIFGVTCILLFGIGVSVQSVNAFECYVCGALDSKCKDPFDKNGGVSKTSCSGWCYKVKGEKSGVQAIERGCILSPGSENKCSESTVYGVNIQSCTCNSNLCNGVLTVQGSFIALVASIAIYLTLF